MRRADDDEQLLFAAVQGRILVSHNARDFILLHAAWRRWSQAWGINPGHAGILIIPNSSWQLTYQGLAQRLDEVVAPGLPVANELYRWRINDGWVREP